MHCKQPSVVVLAITAALVCAVGGSVVWKVERSIRRSLRESASADQIAVSVRTLDRQPNPGFEALSAPAVFKSAAEFNNRLYLSGPAGLFVYSLDGILQHVYRVGPDLPAAPLGRIAVGTLADGHAPELLIATGGQGVLAFDGQRFRQILPGDSESRNITALLPLSSGRLLLGTAKRGLLVYDGETLRAFHPSTSNLYVTALAGTEAELWIGTLDRGVLNWRGGQVEAIGESQGLPDMRVDSLDVDKDSVFAGGPAGVAEIRAGKVVDVLARGSYAHVLQPDHDSLFVGQMEGGILRVSLNASTNRNPLRRSISPRDAFQPDSKLRDLGESPVEQFLREGDALYAVMGSQLLRLERDGEWHSILNAKSALLNDRNVSSLLVASDGRIWVGYFDRGLDILPATGGNPIHVENDQVFCVNRILENPRMSAVAVATANGLVLFGRDGRQKQVLTRDSGLIASHVTDIALYGDGMVAGTPAGITFLDPSGLHSIYAFQGLVNNHVYAVGARGNSLLVGTLGGLSLVSDGVVRRNLTTGNSGLKANWITALAAEGGDWFAGTYGAGIVRMGPDGIVAPTEVTGQGLIVNPGAMIADGRMIFAGTLGKGLLVGDATGTRWKTVTAGLPSLNVTALAIDKGTLYVGTDNGLVKVAEDKLL